MSQLRTLTQHARDNLQFFCLLFLVTLTLFGVVLTLFTPYFLITRFYGDTPLIMTIAGLATLILFFVLSTIWGYTTERREYYRRKKHDR
jgi:uncharacterized membrane protein (DUF485 family)